MGAWLIQAALKLGLLGEGWQAETANQHPCIGLSGRCSLSSWARWLYGDPAAQLSFPTADPVPGEDQGGHVCVLSPVTVRPIIREERGKGPSEGGRRSWFKVTPLSSTLTPAVVRVYTLPYRATGPGERQEEREPARLCVRAEAAAGRFLRKLSMGLTCPSAPAPGHLGTDRQNGHKGKASLDKLPALRGMGARPGWATLGPGSHFCSLWRPALYVYPAGEASVNRAFQ